MGDYTDRRQARAWQKLLQNPGASCPIGFQPPFPLQSKNIFSMPRSDRPNYHPLGKAKNCPCGEQHDVRDPSEKRKHRDGRIKRLQTAEDGERLAHVEATTVQSVMEMVPPGIEWRFARHGSANKTGQAIEHGDRREPEPHNR